MKRSCRLVIIPLFDDWDDGMVVVLAKCARELEKELRHYPGVADEYPMGSLMRKRRRLTGGTVQRSLSYSSKTPI